MEERLQKILDEVKRMEEELTDISFQMLSDYLQSTDAEGTDMKEEMAARQKEVKEIEKSLVKSRGLLEKARLTLEANPALRREIE